MGEPGDGWQTVLPTSHSGIERLGRAQLEVFERQTLKEWESLRGHWSGIGKHTSANDFTEAKKLHPRFKAAVDRVLGSGSYGVVEKVHYTHNNRSVSLARKWIQYRRGRTIQLLREEAHVMEKLDHHHIVKLVGTYCLRNCELYLLLWPVAVCNLDNLFNDLDALRLGLGDREDIIKRLGALELTDLSAVEKTGLKPQPSAAQLSCPLAYLRRIMGCIAHAVAYCHNANIRHLDLKPSNILLNPGGNVYLADFGIARDVRNRDHTMTFGAQGTPKWRAPEICHPEDEWSMKAADIYSLGLVLLNIATIVYGGDMASFDEVVDELTPRARAEKLKQYHANLERQALATQEVADCNAPTFAPKHVLGLTAKMLSLTPTSRPKADEVETELVDLGGIEQIYHGLCCKKSSRFVTDRVNTRFRVTLDERDRLRSEHQGMAKRLEVLATMDTTYEARIQKERKAHGENITKLQEQLNRERKERERLEAELADMRRHPGRKHPRNVGIPRPAVNRIVSSGGVGPAGSAAKTSAVASRTIPTPSPSPSPSPSQKKVSTPPASAVAHGPRPTYSQTAAAGAPQCSPAAVRRPQALERVSTDSLEEPPRAPYSSPSPNSMAGFPLRSRNSGSRLPIRAGSGYTPTRSNTPNFNRDNSLTDSTQASMTSSTFSRRSRDSDSILGTDAMPTPSPGSPVVVTKGISRKTEPVMISAESIIIVEEEAVGLGLDMHFAQRRDSISKDDTIIRDNISVVSSAITDTLSPTLSSSVLSSPGAVKAELRAQGSPVKMPPLPTAKSWADVARKERKK